MQLIRLSKNNFQAERGITRGSAQTHTMYTVFKKNVVFFLQRRFHEAAKILHLFCR